MPEFTAGNLITLGLGVLAWLGTIGVYVYRAGSLKQAFDDRFRTQGERIGDAEATVNRNVARIDDLARKSQQLEFHVTELAKDFGTTQGSLGKLAESIAMQAERSRQDEREIIDRLARIEEQMRFLVQNQSPKGD